MVTLISNSRTNNFDSDEYYSIERKRLENTNSNGSADFRLMEGSLRKTRFAKFFKSYLKIARHAVLQILR